MKKIIYYLFALLVLITSCQTEQITITEEVTFNQKAKTWFESQPESSIKDYAEIYGDPDWENFLKIGHKYYFPLNYESFNKKLTDSDLTDLNRLYFKSYLVFDENENNTLNESLKIFFSTEIEDFKNNLENSSLSYHHYASDNSLIDYKLSEKINEIELTTKSGSECTTYYVVRTDHYSDGTSESIILYSYEVCEGGGGGSGSPGGGGLGGSPGPSPFDEFIDNVENVPPSCKSFKFESVASNWQASTINHFEFGVRTYASDNNVTIYNIDYEQQTITFEAWETDRHNSELSSGAAAEISAEAIQAAMRNTARHFMDKRGFSKTQIRIWFEEDLKNEFSQRSDGGRVTFRTNPYNQTPTKYKTTAWFNDNCD